MSEEQQGLDGGGQPITAPDLEALDTRESILDPVVLRYTVMTYLVVLPVGHLYSVSVFGAMATLSDFFLGIILLAGFAELDRMIPHYRARRKEQTPLLPAHRAFHAAAFLFMAFSGWVALGGLWGFHPGYAVTKGVAYMALGLGALAIVWCGAEWNKAADASSSGWSAGRICPRKTKTPSDSARVKRPSV